MSQKESAVMENRHSWRLRRLCGIIDMAGMTLQKIIFCVYANQDDNPPILRRFPARPIPFNTVNLRKVLLKGK
jgi:hypothetical protein